MKIYDVKSHRYVDSIKDRHVFVYGSEAEITPILEEKGIDLKLKQESNISAINYEVHDKYSHFNFVYYKLINEKFEFTNLNLLVNDQMVIYVMDDHPLNKKFIESFVSDKLFDDLTEESLEELFYALLSTALKQMFTSLVDYETHISDIEDEILTSKNNIKLEDIVFLKNESLNLKKYNRQLLYIGDMLLLNDGLLKVEDRYLKNVDASINKLYEYSNNIYEMSAHLMELFDSKVTASTNNIINKLTIFTVFATPLTVITGIYGMNFVNMPELHHAYGYYYAIGTMIVIDLIIYFVLKKMKLL